MYPDPASSEGSGNPPYLYTNYPTQVAVVSSSLPPTLTSSNTTTSVSTVNTTWNSKLNKWNTKKVTTTLTASITAHLVGTLWIPQAAYISYVGDFNAGVLNVATPSGEKQAQFPGSVLCNPNQNQLDPTLNNNFPNNNYCFINFAQPSGHAGYYLHAYGAYQASGTITENGSVVWTGYLGEKYSATPADQQVQVAVIESVGCSTMACIKAGLASEQIQISPWGTEDPN